MKIVCVVKTMDGCTYHRIYMPHKYVDAEVRNVMALSEEDMEWADIVVYSRHMVVSPKFLYEMKKKHNTKIIVDSDDTTKINKSHPNYSHFKFGDSFLQVDQHLMYADAVTTTQNRLAQEILQINPNVYVAPNGIAYGEEQFKYTEQPERDKLTLLYASSNLNYGNSDLVKNAFTGLDIEFFILGDVGGHYSGIIKQNITGGVIPYNSTGWKPIEEYMDGYIGDVLIVPNKDTYFNSMKSNLKILEAGAKKMPIIVSPTHPYIDEPMPVLYASNKKEWRECVERMMDKSERQALGEQLHKFCVENYDLKTLAKSRMEIYERVLSTP